MPVLPIIVYGIIAVVSIIGLAVISISLKEAVKAGGEPAKDIVENTKGAIFIIAIALLIGTLAFGYKTYKTA